MPFLHGAKQTLSTTSLTGIMIELYRLDESCKTAIALLGDADFEVVGEFEIENKPELVNILLKQAV